MITYSKHQNFFCSINVGKYEKAPAMSDMWLLIALLGKLPQIIHSLTKIEKCLFSKVRQKESNACKLIINCKFETLIKPISMN